MRFRPVSAPRVRAYVQVSGSPLMCYPALRHVEHVLEAEVTDYCQRCRSSKANVAHQQTREPPRCPRAHDTAALSTSSASTDPNASNASTCASSRRQQRRHVARPARIAHPRYSTARVMTMPTDVGFAEGLAEPVTLPVWPRSANAAKHPLARARMRVQGELTAGPLGLAGCGSSMAKPSSTDWWVTGPPCPR